MRDGAGSDQPDEGRRNLLRTVLVAALAICLPACGRSRYGDAADLQLAELERQSGGRLGVAIVELETGEAIGHRADERFGMCSTFKLPLAAIVLMEAERGNLDLAERIRFTADDMVFYAPVTEKHLDRGYMTVGELVLSVTTRRDWIGMSRI